MWSLGLVAVGGLATRGQAAAQAAPRGEVTFTKDIAPILQRSCENCHRRHGVAPMPLSTYEEVRPWARSIKVKTSLREMPPWYIEKYIGIQKFKNDPSLSDEEIATVATWVDRGAPRGNPADMPPQRQYQDTEGWNIGTPDLIVSSPVITVKAVAPDYNNEVGPSPTGLTEDRYIKAIEVKETRLDAAFQRRVAGRTEGDLNYFTLHHAGIQSPGFGMDEDRSGFNFVYNLGAGPTFYPDNTGVVLKAGTELSFRLHMHSVGREMTVRVDVGFKFHPKGFKPKYFQPGGYFANLGNSAKDDLIIPAGEDNVRFDSFTTLRQPVILTTFEPHMHMSGKRMCVEVIYPSGGRRETLNCAGYNHNWVRSYIYEDDAAPLLPTGTILHVMGWYNNSASNPRNIEPRNWKFWGNRSIDDMFIFLPKVTFLTEEQYVEEVAARQAKQRAHRSK
jgi:hypothetical protein